jgi:hypothetical protein
LGRRAGQCIAVCQSDGPAKGFIVNTSQLITLDRAVLTEEVGKPSKRHLDLILSGIDIVLGR